MVIIESNKAYREPHAKVVVMGVRSVLCDSKLSSTEQLVEDDMSETSENSIW